MEQAKVKERASNRTTADNIVDKGQHRTEERATDNKAFAKMAVSLRVESLVQLNIFVLRDSDVRFNPPLRKPPNRCMQFYKKDNLSNHE